MIDEDVVAELAHGRYGHRLSASGEPLDYDAMIARKRRDIPPDLAALRRGAGAVSGRR